jgi:hypothetical protein
VAYVNSLSNFVVSGRKQRTLMELFRIDDLASRPRSKIILFDITGKVAIVVGWITTLLPQLPSKVLLERPTA